MEPATHRWTLLALALYRAADERLYARKVARGLRRGDSVAALV